jgi:hypothetical protein
LAVEDARDPSIATRKPAEEEQMQNPKGFFIRDTQAIRNGLRKGVFGQ